MRGCFSYGCLTGRGRSHRDDAAPPRGGAGAVGPARPRGALAGGGVAMEGRMGTRGWRVGRRRLLAVTGAGGAAAFVAACGGDKDSKDSGEAIREATVISSTAAPSTQGGTPKPGGTLNLATTGNAPL